MAFEYKLGNPLEAGQVPNSRATLAPAASATVVATLAEILDGQVNVTTPASGTGTITCPPAHLWKNKIVTFVTLNTGGGEVTIASDAGDRTALSVGDNVSAAADYVTLLSTGERLIVLAEVTT